MLLLIILFIFFTSCEDTKKSTTNSEKILTETPQIKKSETEIKKEKTTKKFPIITQDNLVEFLTAYGKDNPETKVRISTSLGIIDLKLFKDTPLHRANFIYLVKQGYFNETFFHRVSPNFIIQAGSSDLKSTFKKRAEIGGNYTLPYEKGNGRIHQSGTVSGAKEYRENPDNRSAPFEFFIFLGPKSSTAHLNGKYTIFGKVTKGMDVVESISKLPADDGEWPIDNLYITAEIIE